jgi:polysaccharide export outer membrane protein
MRTLIVVSALAIAASGCAMQSGPRPSAMSGGPPDAAADLVSAGDRARLGTLATERTHARGTNDYRIAPDDLLDIRIPDLIEPQGSATVRAPAAGPEPVAGAPVFQQGVRVSGAGEIRLPLLGTIKAAGRTPGQLEQDIARRLIGAGLLRTPQVSVQVAEYRGQVVAVVGSVERPGLYPVTRPGATLADLIWSAGGPSKDAGRVVDFVPARASGAPGDKDRPLRLDLETLLDSAGQQAATLNPEVRPGDVIKLAPAGSVMVDGWVEKPGSYPVTRALTLSGAIAAAGGRLFAAERDRAVVTRVAAGEQQSFTIAGASDVPIIDGDVVHVPPAPSRLVPWSMWSIAREMVHVGGNVLLF